MTQVDLESPVSISSGGSNDRKIVCETLAKAAGVKPEKQNIPDDGNELPPDFPPESFCLSKDAELDWFDRNAFLERKESAKGNISHGGTNVTPNLHPSSNSSSQRIPLTLKTKTTFFGLPKSSSVDSKRKTCKPVNIRFFPTKRSESALKAVSQPEPVSPKVSCMGRVRSKKGRRRSSCEAASKKCEISLERSKSSRAPKRKIGFYARVLSIFGFGRSHIKPVKATVERAHDSIPEEPVPPRKSNAVVVEKVRKVPVSVEPVTDSTGLGGMMRFTSGRRSESWAADEIDAVLSELGSDRKVGPNGRN